MPINNDLEPIELPMELKFGQQPTTTFHNNLRALTTELVDAPTTEQARNVAWHYVKATWADQPNEIDPTTAADEHSCYGCVLSRMGDQVVMKVLVTNPKDEAEKDYVVTYAIECKKMAIKQRGESKWEKIDKTSVAQSLWSWACK